MTSPSTFSLQADQNDTSVTLDLLRLIAAQAVCVGHAFSFFDVANYARPPFAPYMQNIGVIIFFVLSGFLIAHALERAVARPRLGFAHYLVDRSARIYSALIPALLAIAALDLTLIAYQLHANANYVSWKSFFGTLLMMQNYPNPFGPSLEIPSFGSAGQLWSLAVEFHLYLCVGGLFFMLRGARHTWIGAVLATITLAVPLMFLKASLVGPGSGLSWLWLLGFCSYYLARSEKVARGIPTFFLYLLAAALAVWWWRDSRTGEYSVHLYPVVAASFALLVLATQRTGFLTKKSKITHAIRWGADYSFSLYLIHYSLLFGLHALWKDGGWSAALLGILVSNLAALLLASLGEFHYRAIGLWIKQRLGLESKKPRPAEPEAAVLNQPEAAALNQSVQTS